MLRRPLPPAAGSWHAEQPSHALRPWPARSATAAPAQAAASKLCQLFWPHIAPARDSGSPGCKPTNSAANRWGGECMIGKPRCEKAAQGDVKILPLSCLREFGLSGYAASTIAYRRPRERLTWNDAASTSAARLPSPQDSCSLHPQRVPKLPTDCY